MKTLIRSHKRIVLLLAAVLCVVAVPYVSDAQTYSHIYVDAVNGVNAATGRGTAAAPYKTITYALLISKRNNLSDPWHVHIRPGTYTADPAKPATERELFPIRLRSDMIFEGTTNAKECILDAEHLGHTSIPILLGENASGVHIRNLTIQNMLGYQDSGQREIRYSQIILSGEGQKPNTLKGCIVHQDAKHYSEQRNQWNSNVSGLWTSIPLVLVENTFSNNHSRSTVFANNNVVATDNTFRDNQGTALYINGDSIGDITGNFFGRSIASGSHVRITGSMFGNISDNTFNGGQGSGVEIGSVGDGAAYSGKGEMEGDVSHNIFRDFQGSHAFNAPAFTGNITHNTFTNNRVAYYRGGTGVYVLTNFTGNITHNTFTNNDGNGVYLHYGPFTGNVTHNTFTNNRGKGFHAYRMEGDIADNEFTSNASGGVTVYFELIGNVTRNIFDSQSVNYDQGPAIQLDWPGTQNKVRAHGYLAEISNNIFFNNKLDPNLDPGNINKIKGITLATGMPVHVVNNLFMLTSEEPVRGEYKPHIWVTSIATPESRFHNNIFVGMHIAINLDGAYDIPITHNIFHNIGQDIVSQGGGGLGNDVAFWELFAENASDNLAAAPRLVNPLGKNFHLQAGSPAIDAGTDAYAPDDDLDGAARPAGDAVDIGPYEYGAKKRQDDPPSDADNVSVTPDPPVAVYPAWDVNEDGTTDITDLILVAAALGTGDLENPRLDVNGDGVVDISDLILVASHLGETTEAAAPVIVELPEHFTPETLQQVLKLLRTQHDGSPVLQRAIANLERLLASLIPKETLLLANYPNPFNPETWIPYQLSKSADVALHIHSMDGTLVRALSLGHKVAGMYHGRSRAAYWDGKNAAGEVVSSGVYFYTLTAGDFSATRRMLIRK